ncbi:creatininase family protein [Actinomadura chibensis]|uniref:Creatininase family protein n=1 Tax=Actinomadura chibensis TaxID=392828 RepID=A0A5D0NEZ8_9ACTN|nr:creatininase family protein [Actinomadura chibensis]TYB42937.1 creatininase family protein [Actinomadura chibensis]
MLPTHTSSEVPDVPVAVLPVGSHEQHGPFLPLATDTVIACTIAAEIAKAHPVRTLPPVTISCSHEHAAWPGTVSISAATLHALVRDVAESLRRAGVPKLVLVNGHGGNYVLGNAVQEAHGDMALFPGLDEWEDARRAAGMETGGDADMHAGELETSILLHAHPELVRDGYETADHLAGDRRSLLTLGMAPYTASGVIGRPSLASAGKGRDALGSLVAAFGGCLAALQGQDGRARQARDEGQHAVDDGDGQPLR